MTSNAFSETIKRFLKRFIAWRPSTPQPINNTKQKKNTVLLLGCFGLATRSGVFPPFSIVRLVCAATFALKYSCITAVKVFFLGWFAQGLQAERYHVAHCYFRLRYYFLLCSGWLLLFPGVLWMVTVISWCALDVHCYFLVCSGWSLLFTGVPWMVTVISWCALDGHCCFLVCCGWSLLFPGVLWMVTVISWCALDGHCSFVVCRGCSLLFPARMGRAMACAISRAARRER